jgi:hypothetical protein
MEQDNQKNETKKDFFTYTKGSFFDTAFLKSNKISDYIKTQVLFYMCAALFIYTHFVMHSVPLTVVSLILLIFVSLAKLGTGYKSGQMGNKIRSIMEQEKK